MIGGHTLCTARQVGEVLLNPDTLSDIAYEWVTDGLYRDVRVEMFGLRSYNDRRGFGPDYAIRIKFKG